MGEFVQKPFLLMCLWIAIGMACLETPRPAEAEAPAPPKSFSGHLVSFAWGDYLHATFKTSAGEEIQLFVHGEDCFLAQHHDALLTVTYKIVQEYIPEGRGKFPVQIITRISTDAGAVWTSDPTPPLSSEKRKECDDLIRRLTVEN